MTEIESDLALNTTEGRRPGRVRGADQSRSTGRAADEGCLGGELARFLLALKVALADRGSAPTLVFDEIDTAVGGAVAEAISAPSRTAVGERVQVLAVTHARRLPRVPTSIC